jgi:hypothetical protein
VSLKTQFDALAESIKKLQDEEMFHQSFAVSGNVYDLTPFDFLKGEVMKQLFGSSMKSADKEDLFEHMNQAHIFVINQLGDFARATKMFHTRLSTSPPPQVTPPVQQPVGFLDSLRAGGGVSRSNVACTIDKDEKGKPTANFNDLHGNIARCGDDYIREFAFAFTSYLVSNYNLKLKFQLGDNFTKALEFWKKNDARLHELTDTFNQVFVSAAFKSQTTGNVFGLPLKYAIYDALDECQDENKPENIPIYKVTMLSAFSETVCKEILDCVPISSSGTWQKAAEEARCKIISSIIDSLVRYIATHILKIDDATFTKYGVDIVGTAIFFDSFDKSSRYRGWGADADMKSGKKGFKTLVETLQDSNRIGDESRYSLTSLDQITKAGINTKQHNNLLPTDEAEAYPNIAFSDKGYGSAIMWM